MTTGSRILIAAFSGVICEKIIGLLAAVASNHLFANVYGAYFFGELQFALSLAYVVGSMGLVFSAEAVAPILGKHPRLRHIVIYQAFRLRLGSSLTVAIIFLTAVAFAIHSSSTTITLVAGLVILVEPVSLGALMAYAETRPWVITRAKAYASGARVLWLVMAAHASVGAAVASLAWPLEACVAAAAPFSRYRTLAWDKPKHLFGSELIAKTLVVRGLKIWPAIAASVLVLRMDRLLLGVLMSKSDLGIYSAAAALVEQWNSVGVTLSLALAPSMVYAARGEHRVRTRALGLAAVLAAIAFVAWITSFFIGERIFLMIYGRDFAAGVPVMIFASGCAIVSFADAGLSTWLVAERLYALVVLKQTLTIAAIGLLPLIVPSVLLMYAPSIATAASLTVFWCTVWTRALVRRQTA